MHLPGAADRLFQSLPDLRIEGPERLIERGLRHQGGGQVDAVEPDSVLAHRLRAAVPHVVAYGADQGNGGLDVGGGPGQDPGQGGPAEPSGLAPAQVDTGNHPPSLRRARFRRLTCPHAGRGFFPRWPGGRRSRPAG